MPGRLQPLERVSRHPSRRGRKGGGRAAEHTADCSGGAVRPGGGGPSAHRRIDRPRRSPCSKNPGQGGGRGPWGTPGDEPTVYPKWLDRRQHRDQPARVRKITRPGRPDSEEIAATSRPWWTNAAQYGIRRRRRTDPGSRRRGRDPRSEAPPGRHGDAGRRCPQSADCWRSRAWTRCSSSTASPNRMRPSPTSPDTLGCDDVPRSGDYRTRPAFPGLPFLPCPSSGKCDLATRRERPMWIRCNCGTPGCSSSVVLGATHEHFAEGTCPACGASWLLTGGDLRLTRRPDQSQIGPISGQVPVI